MALQEKRYTRRFVLLAAVFAAVLVGAALSVSGVS